MVWELSRSHFALIHETRVLSLHQGHTLPPRVCYGFRCALRILSKTSCPLVLFLFLLQLQRRASMHHEWDEQGLLPSDVVAPLAYDVHLALAGPPDLATKGMVDVTIVVKRPTAVVRLHSVGLKLNSASVGFPDGTFTATEIYSTSPQIVAIDIKSPLSIGQYIVRLSFSGRIGTIGHPLRMHVFSFFRAFFTV